MIKVKGKWEWNWNVLDEETRFLIANNLTGSRFIDDARQVFKKAKQVATVKPEFIVSDGLWSYEKSIAREFPSNNPKSRNSTKHVRLESFEKKPNNNIIERYHNSFREFDKVRRGFKSENTAQGISDGFRVYYNFVRKHKGISNQTPAEKSGISLNLDRNRWLSLLKQSMKSKV